MVFGVEELEYEVGFFRFDIVRHVSDFCSTFVVCDLKIKLEEGPYAS